MLFRSTHTAKLRKTLSNNNKKYLKYKIIRTFEFTALWDRALDSANWVAQVRDFYVARPTGQRTHKQIKNCYNKIKLPNRTRSYAGNQVKRCCTGKAYFLAQVKLQYLGEFS